MAGIFQIGHTGSWGTPEILVKGKGLTEHLSDAFGLARTSQGGSQLKGTYDAGPTAIYKDQETGAQGTLSQLYPRSNTLGAVDNNASGGNTGGGNAPPPAPTGINMKDPNANPGPGYFWDAADGWKPVSGGGGAPDLYAEIGRAFDEVLGGLGGQQTDMEGRIRGLADTQRSGINEQLGFGIENLDRNRENVRTNQASTLADLAQNLRDQAKGVNMYLGARGVGGGSASEAASFALQKLFGRERAGVQKQGMAQLGEIDMAETNLRAKASEMLNSVEGWYNSQMADIASKFNDLRNNIGMMKADMRMRAVESLWNEYNRVQSQRESYSQAISQEARSRMQQLTNMKLELQNNSNFDPRAMTYNEYGFDPSSAYAPANYDAGDMFNPLAMARRRQDEI